MNDKEYVFGANTIENLTTGMYQDSRIIYREYIQNACDSIDKAKKINLLGDKDGFIDIIIDPIKRSIIVEDNATGIPADDFEKTLGDVANSSKKIGEDKGFRGIGKLAGLAYCKKLIFSSSVKGENVISKMECDAVLMRELINEHNQGNKHTAIEILQKTYKFSSEYTADKDSHFFRVQILDVNDENKDLLKIEEIREYLSFVAPVPYYINFYIKTEVYRYAKEHNHQIDEYVIRVNGQQIFKEYELNYKTRSGDDSIRSIEFHEFKDDNGHELGWMWLGISGFKGAIPESCKMRCIRLRKENIQIGNENTLQEYFKEGRGGTYFIGEVFATSANLIPNAQRNFFNENLTRYSFVQELKKYFRELSRIYHYGSELNTHFKNLREFDKETAKYNEMKRKGDFLNSAEEKKAKKQLDDTRAKAASAEKAIKKLQEKENNGIADGIIVGVANKRMDEYEKEKKETKKNDNKQSSKPSKGKSNSAGKPGIWTDRFSSYSKEQRKLIERICNAIDKTVDKEIAEKIRKAIEIDLLS